jgi:hypothetical protein
LQMGARIVDTDARIVALTDNQATLGARIIELTENQATLGTRMVELTDNQAAIQAALQALIAQIDRFISGQQRDGHE